MKALLPLGLILTSLLMSNLGIAGQSSNDLKLPSRETARSGSKSESKDLYKDLKNPRQERREKEYSDLKRDRSTRESEWKTKAFDDLRKGRQLDLGGESAGGGFALVCRESKGPKKGQIKGEALFYDLFEGANDPKRNLKIQKSKESVAAQIEARVQTLRVATDSRFENTTITTLRRALALVERDWTVINPGTRLPVRPDFNPEILPKDPCYQLEPVAFYDDKNVILQIDGEIYDRMPNTDKAALKMHEAIYKVNRLFSNARNSDQSRREVARFFSDSPSFSFRADFANIERLNEEASGEFLMSMHAFDFLLGGKTLFCTGKSQNSAIVLSGKMGVAMDRWQEGINDDRSLALYPTDEKHRALDVTGRHQMVVIDIEPNQTYANGPVFSEYFLDIIDNSSGPSSLTHINLRQLMTDAVYSKGKPLTGVKYSSSPEYGEDIDFSDLPMTCVLK